MKMAELLPLSLFLHASNDNPQSHVFVVKYNSVLKGHSNFSVSENR